MVGSCRPPRGYRIVPDLVAALCLPVEHESGLLQSAYDPVRSWHGEFGRQVTATGILIFLTVLDAGVIPAGSGSPCSM